MSLKMRLLFFGVIGLLAGALAWPPAEVLLLTQASFPTLLLFSIVLGLAIGAIMGGAFGASEGIVTASGMKIRSGVLTGVLVGGVGGLIGFVVGQGALLLLGTSVFNSAGGLRSVGLPLSKAIGWAAFGVFIGSVEGIRSRSGNTVRNGIIGGVIGGLLGGLVFEFLRAAAPDSMYARLLGLLVLGLAIGVCYAVVELRVARAGMYLLNGAFKGKEFPLSRRVTSIGSSEEADICIPGYAKVAPFHAEVRKEKNGEYVLRTSGDGAPAMTMIDDKSPTASAQSLRDGNVVRVGSAQFRFQAR